MALFIGPFWVLLCIFWLNSVVFWGNSWLVFNADVLQRFFIQFLNFLKDLQKFCLKRLFLISQFCIVNLIPAFWSCSVCPFFRSGAISGWVWMGWDLCAGLLYEHRFAMLISASKFQNLSQIALKNHGVWGRKKVVFESNTTFSPNTIFFSGKTLLLRENMILTTKLGLT